MRNVKQPLRNEVLVRMLKKKAIVNGICLPDKELSNSREGIVVLLGPRCSTDLVRGMHVLLPEDRVYKLTLGTIEYRIFKEDQILAILEEEAE